MLVADVLRQWDVEATVEKNIVDLGLIQSLDEKLKLCIGDPSADVVASVGLQYDL